MPMNRDEDSVAALLDCELEEVEALVAERVGIQRYARLRVVAGLVFNLAGDPGFNRADARTICAEINVKTLDRALSDMEAADMIEVLATNDHQQRGGAVYRVTSPMHWQLRDPEKASARAKRSNRGRKSLSN